MGHLGTSDDVIADDVMQTLFEVTEDSVNEYLRDDRRSRKLAVQANEVLIDRLEAAIKDNMLLREPEGSVIVEIPEHVDLALMVAVLEYITAVHRVDLEEGKGFPFLAAVLPKHYFKVVFRDLEPAEVPEVEAAVRDVSGGMFPMLRHVGALGPVDLDVPLEDELEQDMKLLFGKTHET